MTRIKGSLQAVRSSTGHLDREAYLNLVPTASRRSSSYRRRRRREEEEEEEEKQQQQEEEDRYLL